MKIRTFAVGFSLVCAMCAPLLAQADWQVYYSGQAQRMFGAGGRGHFATRAECEAYNNSRPGFERNNSYCSGFDRPSSTPSRPSGASGDGGAAEREQEKQRQIQAQKAREEAKKTAREEREAELARQRLFTTGKEQLIRELKGTSPGTLGLKDGTVAAPRPGGTSIFGLRSGADPVPGTVQPVTCPDGSRVENGRCVALNLPTAFESFYTTETRTFLPMNGGGHPIDAIEPPPKDGHGLVGGTTWTYGFKRPQMKCDQHCKADLDRRLKLQLLTYCAQKGDAKDAEKCVADGLPFTPEIYDMVISMGSYNTALYDLATRVVFDGATYGEYSRQHKEIFASLKGRRFDVLDCHSNGAMLCLAALRSGDTAAKEVRLFGPQINPEAAKIWRDYSRRTGTKITVYINSGDPIAPVSWLLPTPPAGNDWNSPNVWLLKTLAVPGNLAAAAFNSFLDGEKGVMNTVLGEYGIDVVRSKCKTVPSLDCHSMKLYEKQIPDKLPAPPRGLPKK